jgi:hypothetical protein
MTTKQFQLLPTPCPFNPHPSCDQALYALATPILLSALDCGLPDAEYMMEERKSRLQSVKEVPLTYSDGSTTIQLDFLITHILVSTANVPFSGPETYIFVADANGMLWGRELDGSQRGHISHQEALSASQFTFQSPGSPDEESTTDV